MNSLIIAKQKREKQATFWDGAGQTSFSAKDGLVGSMTVYLLWSSGMKIERPFQATQLLR